MILVDLNPSSFFSELDTGWPWPLSAVQGFFESLYNAIANIASRVWDYFQSKLVEALQWMWSNFVLPLWRYARDVYYITVEWTAGWSEPWSTIAKLFLFPAAFTYKFMRDYIAPRFTEVLNGVKTYFDGAVGGIFNAIRNAFSPIFDPLAKFADTVYKFFTETLPSWIRLFAEFIGGIPLRLGEFFARLGEAITASISTASTTIVDALGKLFTEALPSALQSLTSALGEKLMESFKNAWQWLNENVVPTIKDALMKIWDTIYSFIKSIIEGFMAFINVVRRHAEKADIVSIVLSMLPLISLSMTIAGLVDVTSIKIAGSGVDIHTIRQQITKLLDALIDPKMFTSIFLAIAIQKPLEYAAKYMFRTEIPGPGDLLRFYAKNWITYEQLHEAMARHGYSDEWISIYERSVWQEPRFDAVFTAYKRGVISEADYRRWLNILNIMQERRPGMEKADITVFEEAMYRMPGPFVLAYAADTGMLSEADIKRVLEYELIHPRFIDVTAKALAERALRDDKALVRRYAIETFVDGVISLGDLEAILRNMNVAAEFINALTPLLSTVRERKLRNKTVSYLERAFLDGYISREDFVNQLTALGIEREFVHRYAMLLDYVRANYYIIKETKDERSRYASLIEDMMAKGAMTESEARMQLLGLGLTDAEVELRLRRAKLAYENEDRKIRLNDLIERMKQGLIDRALFTDECISIGYSRERCVEWAKYYWSKYVGADFLIVTKDERNALANALTKLYVAGFMSEEELRGELRRLGFLDIEIDLRIKRVEVEDRLKMLSDLLAEADAMLKKGMITVDDYVEYLVSLGMRRERAEARARRIMR